MSYANLVTMTDRAVQTHLGGTTAIYAPEVGDPVAGIPGIFDESYVLVDEGNSGVEQIVPAFWVLLSDLPRDPDDDDPVLTIEGADYTIRERKPDGKGGIMLLLYACR